MARKTVNIFPNKGFAPGPDPKQLSPDYSPAALNVTFEQGRILSRPGFTRLNTSAYSGPITGLYEFIKRNGEEWFLSSESVTGGTSIYVRAGGVTNLTSFVIFGHNGNLTAGEAVKSSDGGTTWTPVLQGAPIADYLNASCVTPTGYLIGLSSGDDTNAKAYVSTDRGETWSTNTIATAHSGTKQRDCKSWDALLTFAVGLYWTGSWDRYVLVSSNDYGLTWNAPAQVASLPAADNYANTIHRISYGGSAGRLLLGVVVGAGDTRKLVHYSDDDGATWTAATTTFPAEIQEARAFGERSDGTVYCAFLNQFYESADGGNNWTRKDVAWNGVTGVQVHDLYVVSDNLFLVKGTVAIGGVGADAVLYSLDFGANWNLAYSYFYPTSSTFATFSRFKKDSKGNLYLSRSTENIMLYSVDNGLNWITFATNPITAFVGSRCYNCMEIP